MTAGETMPAGRPEATLLPLWHIAHRADWEAAREVGVYLHSTRGRTLGEEGFIHCSYPHQVGLVARGFYADDPEPLVILEVDRDKLGPTKVRVERIADFDSLGRRMAAAGTLLGAEGEAGFAWMAQDLSPCGATGNACLASAGMGARLVTHYAQQLARLLQETYDFDLSCLRDEIA